MLQNLTTRYLTRLNCFIPPPCRSFSSKTSARPCFFDLQVVGCQSDSSWKSYLEVFHSRSFAAIGLVSRTSPRPPVTLPILYSCFPSVCSSSILTPLTRSILLAAPIVRAYPLFVMASNAPQTPKLDRYVVIHVATTCDEHGVYVTKDSAEVIELGWILLDTKSCEEVSRSYTFHFSDADLQFSRYIARVFSSNLSIPRSRRFAVSLPRQVIGNIS